MLSHELDSGGSISLYAIINRVEVAGKGYNPAAICLVFVMLIRMCKDKVLSRIQFAGLDYSCYVTLLFERISHLSPDFRCRRSVQLANVCSLSLCAFQVLSSELARLFQTSERHSPNQTYRTRCCDWQPAPTSWEGRV